MKCFIVVLSLVALCIGDVAGVEPLIYLDFNENTGTTASNKGSLGGSLMLTEESPVWSTNVPAIEGNTSSLDFGAVPGIFRVESDLDFAKENLTGISDFTITGWLNIIDPAEGPGGNRVVSTIFAGGDGIDVVYHSDGSMNIGINQWPDGVPTYSSPGMITFDSTADPSNWVFFAVTYSDYEIIWYFGNNSTVATFNEVREYSRGPVGTECAELSIGLFNSATIAKNGVSLGDRVLRGLADEIAIFDVVLTEAEIVAVQKGGESNAVKDRQATVHDFRLEQNYPNPFNPSTTIGFTLDKKEHAQLCVYNMLGKQVATLADQVMDAGSYTVHFNASDMPSGVYFYKLITSSSMLTRKAVFIR